MDESDSFSTRSSLLRVDQQSCGGSTSKMGSNPVGRGQEEMHTDSVLSRDEGDVRCSVSPNGCCIITLHRPSALNALTLGLVCKHETDYIDSASKKKKLVLVVLLRVNIISLSYSCFFWILQSNRYDTLVICNLD